MTNELPETTAGTIFQLLYRSRDRLPADNRAEELAALFATARSNNKKLDITGALLVSSRWFVQVLEGPEAAVRSLYATIAQDSRHGDIELLYAGPVDRRTFAHWSMGKVDLADTDLPLIARISEISPANSERMTPAMRHLLDVMRGAVDDAPVGSSPRE